MYVACTEDLAALGAKMRGPLCTIGALAVLITTGCTGDESNGSPQATATATLSPLQTAPESARVDLAEPAFSNPTQVTNPLFPISNLHSALLLGTEDGGDLRVETTLLAEPKTIEVNGQQIQTLESQYIAFLDGRLKEVALDWYAQADDGSVWYFGEDVFNYEDGELADRDGTWLAGKDGPVAMIMPASPQVGDVYRPENIPDLVFEEVTVEETGRTVYGPRGPVPGAMTVSELHLLEGNIEGKIFAPGYGEFLTGAGDDLEALALAVPADAHPGPMPADLGTLVDAALVVYGAAQSEDWSTAAAAANRVTAAWEATRARGVPLRIEDPLSGALVRFVSAVDSRQVAESSQAALDVARLGLDLQLPYRPVSDIDLDRFELWVMQVLVDTDAEDTSAVMGDSTTLGWVWDRVAPSVSQAFSNEVSQGLAALEAAAGDEDVAAAAEAASALRETVAGAQVAR